MQVLDIRCPRCDRLYPRVVFIDKATSAGSIFTECAKCKVRLSYNAQTMLEQHKLFELGEGGYHETSL